MKKKIILITGARKGIGRFLAEHFISKNFIVIGCSRMESDLRSENYFHYSLDITDENSICEMMQNIRTKFNKIDILINNAGIASMNHSLLTPGSTVKKIFETNLLGTFICSREAIKLMKKNKFGRIINFSSVAVPLNLEGESIYSASKSAVEQLTKVMSREVSEYGITINAIAPTPIETDLIKAVPKVKIEKLLQRQAIKRLGNFKDVSNVIEFFISENSSFITGQVIYLGGI